MIELNYLKDLPIKCINDNKQYIEVEGATLYIDEASNRYAYVAFVNKFKKPIFAMILFLNEYDINGHLIKKERYYIPHCYIAKGVYIIEKPIQIDNNCEALEVEVALAFYSNKVFAKNTLMNRDSVEFAFPRLSDNVPLRATTNNAFKYPGVTTKEDLLDEGVAPEEVEARVASAKEEAEYKPEAKEELTAEEVTDFINVASKAKLDYVRRIIIPIAIILVGLAIFLFVFNANSVPPGRYRG